IPGKVEVVERLGDRTHLHVRLMDGSLLVAEDKGISQVQPGDSVRLAVEGANAHLFDADGLAYHARQ
ncbi:MAG: transporter ATP-binding protein, partial [Proteobacteria bacterium]|nr:transporter ATP-binding protein [Pseudomonadota bacterium]